MQALPSFTASGEQFVGALPPPVSPPAAPFLSWESPAHHAAVLERAWGERTYSPPQPSLTSVAHGIGLAHDAGNLLAAIRLYCDLLALPGVLRSEHRHYAEELRHLSARGGSMIDRLLRPANEAAPAREERGFEGVRLAEVVTGCRGLLHTIAGEQSLLLSVEAGAMGQVDVPREAVERILVNLVKNAAEAGGTEEGHGPITVRVRSMRVRATIGEPRTRAGIALSVEDRGRGMEESKVMALLAGGGPGAGERPGRGLGLQVVRELVTGTGGEMRIHSRPGRGTTIEMAWVCREDDASESG